jgi:hypothetical protein
MELILNLAWAVLASLGIYIWLRFGARTGANRRTQLVALAMLLLILFPVISVSDDILTFHNPAEADCCLRRDHVVSSPHSVLPALAGLPQPIFTELPSGMPRFIVLRNSPFPTVDRPGLTAIQNRPPPTA